jgi:hypothetical protein
VRVVGNVHVYLAFGMVEGPVMFGVVFAVVRWRSVLGSRTFILS